MTHVVKVGGSLCDWPHLPARLAEWLDRQLGGPTVLVAGGGPLADQVREAEPRWGLSPETSHRAALAAMRVVATLVAGALVDRLGRPLLHAATWDELTSELDRWRTASLADPATSAIGLPVIMVDLGGILSDREAYAARPLVARSWRVTSDSLAAWLALELQQQGHGPIALTLLKSTALAAPAEYSQWQTAGLVDEAFHEYAQGLSVMRLVNLRANSETITTSDRDDRSSN